MKTPLLMSLTATLFVANLVAGGVALAQDRIYRCGNEYTNTVAPSQRGSCKLLEGGNVTVVKSPRFASPVVRVATSDGPRVDGMKQRSRDADARLILESELRKAEARHEELNQEYNNGEPEKLGPETRNHQKYLDRLAALKAGIERSENDMAGIRRELGRIPE